MQAENAIKTQSIYGTLNIEYKQGTNEIRQKFICFIN